VRTRDRDVAELLLERQADGLRIPAIARILFSTYGAISALTIGASVKTLLLVFVIVGVYLATNIYFLFLLRRRRHVEAVGWIGVLFDAANVATYPLVLSALFAPQGIHWTFGLNGTYGLVFLTFVAINALALRPLYPTVVGSAAILTHVGMLLVARGDPAVTWSNDLRELSSSSAVSTGMIVSQTVFIAIIVTAVFFITRSARRTVQEAVERQAERARLVREHAASVMEGRLDALRNLVASLSHEMNSPVGAVKSASATIGSAVGRLADQVEGRNEQVERLVSLIRDTAQIPEEACARLDALLQRLTVFSHLDASDASLVDVNEALDRTVNLIPAEVIGESEVTRNYGAHSQVRVPPARLNLALMTILTNAFEANGGRGQVRLGTTEDASSVAIEIADQGPGIPEDRLQRIFEFHIEDASSRIKAGLGLPAAYSLIKKHGGDIAVQSEGEGGACFVITLPRSEASRGPEVSASA
jgi:signal transduction histidine kinase